MIDWTKPLVTSNGMEVKVLQEFYYDIMKVYMLQLNNGAIFFRTPRNEHITLGDDDLYCSGIKVQNKPERLHKAIYEDGSIDDNWCEEELKKYNEGPVLLYIYKEGDKVTYE